MLDPDPDEMNADPQPCFTHTKQLSLSLGSEESTFSTKTEKGSKNQRGDANYIWQLFSSSLSNKCKHCM
jgi:hypothetical protein